MNRRTVIAGVALIGVFVLALVAWNHRAEAPIAPVTPETATTTPSETNTAPQSALVRTDTTVALKTAEVQGTAVLVADGTRYALTAPEGATLKDAMDRLQAESTFTYAYTNYGGLGAFVTAINGRASTGDMVWILYVDGKKSGTGVSSTRIRSGSVIEWKLEKSY